MDSIVTALGAGSGIDIRALVTQLATASRAPREAALTQRAERNEARISGLAQMAATIDNFSTSLSALATGGSLRAQASSSDAAAVAVTARPTASGSASTASATIEVLSLARAQSLVSTNFANSAAAVGEGVFAITTASGTTQITIDSSNNSLSGVSAAINASASGIRARIVSDADGTRLALTGSTGAAAAFEIGIVSGSGSGIERLAYASGGGAMTLAQPAADAVVKIDGIELRRPTNRIDDAVDGISIDLRATTIGRTVALTSSLPTAELGSAINDFVSAFNEVRAQIDALAQGDSAQLRSEPVVADLRKRLSALTTGQLSSRGPGPHSLAEIGVRTNRDGTLSVDAVRLASALGKDAVAIARFFAPEAYSDSSALTITSDTSRLPPGSYQLTNIVTAANGNPASGFIDGLAMTAAGSNLVAPRASPVAGLILSISGDAAQATITIDPGLAGSLRAIGDSLKSASGPLVTSQERLRREAKAIAEDSEKLDRTATRYEEQLLRTFAAMDSRVAGLRATQSYLTQQIAIWNSSDA